MRLPTLSVLTLLGALFLLVLLPVGARAQTFRQSYSPHWQYHPRYKYYWRYYYYKPSHSHYAIYYPSRGKRIYYYNPSTKRYWGYYDVEEKGYSLLPEKWRRPSLNDIPAEVFPKPDAEMPLIPGEKPPVRFEPPRDELPPLKEAP